MLRQHGIQAVIQHAGFVGCALRGTGQLPGIIRPVAGQVREHRMAQRIAPVARIGIAFVGDPAPALLPGHAFQFVATPAQQGPPDGQPVVDPPRRHGSQSVCTASAQGGQQHGFGQVIGVVRQCHDLAASVAVGGIACPPGLGFQALPATADDGNPLDAQRDGQLPAQVRAEAGPVIRMGTQAMVYVHSPQRDAMAGRAAGQGLQKHHGIHSAGQADLQNTLAGRQCLRPMGMQVIQQGRKMPLRRHWHP